MLRSAPTPRRVGSPTEATLDHAGRTPVHPTDPHTPRPTLWLIAVLTCALLALSASGILVRHLPEVDAIAIAWWRCLGSALLLAPFLRRVSPADALRIAVGGVALGVHFAAWFASLKHTTVMHATVLVCMTPAWVGLYEWQIEGARLGRAFWLGLTASMLGVALMTTESDATISLWGDLLAVFAGLLAMVFVLVGRDVRQRVGLASYGGWQCVAATGALTAIVGWQQTPLGDIDQTEGLILALCVLGPQLIGHNGFNYALRYLPATTVSSLLLLEPVGATLLAIWLFGEVPPPVAALGGSLVVLGVVAAQTAAVPTDPSASPAAA